jgi:hypothetical protein
MDNAPLPEAQVYVSYASHDREQVLGILRHLEEAGIPLWLDRRSIPGGADYGEEIVRAVKRCRAVILMCSEASLRSRNVKREIQLAWKYDRPYLPLLLEPSLVTGFPEQVEYWLEASQWIVVAGRTPEQWVPEVVWALTRVGAGSDQVGPPGRTRHTGPGGSAA